MEQLTQQRVNDILTAQKKYFRTGRTLPLAYRIRQLENLYQAILSNEQELYQALYQDLGKSKYESYMSEIGMVLADISHTKKHLKHWIKSEKVSAPLYLFGTKNKVMFQPFGSVLIMGPYNYPFQLLIEPLVGAIAAGNCCVLSPSELTPTVAKVVQKMIRQTFAADYVYCAEGGIENNTVLLHSRFDYIFFTGSVQVGKIVRKAAAENLIPVTLEPGGKSPVIEDSSANLEIACKRIVWGKFMNAGQTCVAPDYVLVDKKIFEAFTEKMQQTIVSFYGKNIKTNKDYGRIVNDRHMQRIAAILEKDKEYIRFGGEVDFEQKYIQPTLLCPPDFGAACMQEELFAPVLPIFAYKKLDDAIQAVNDGETPLALYVFSENKAVVETVLEKTASGGVSVNDTISHIINPNLPFGGKGFSGMGNYHGKNSFLTFSHKRAVLSKSTKIDIRLTFPPFNEKALKKVRSLLK